MSTGTMERIEAIARRVRVLSMTHCEFDARRIDAPPPLPRRYPIIPLIERLQPELYAHAYCVRLGTSHAPEESADMLAALGAANASHTRIDPDWIVHEVDGMGAVMLSKRGATRRIPLSEIFQDPKAPKAPPQPGRLASVVLPREHPDEGGFYFAFGEAPDSTLEGRPALRFYWNVGAAEAPALMRSLTATMNAHRIPFAFKCPRNAAAYSRADAGTLFIHARWLTPTAVAVAEIHRAVASALRPDVPLFALELAPGLGFAEDPGTGESFGMVRTRLLAEALWTAFARGVKGTARIVDEIRLHFLLNGIELEQGHLNPWSVDRYEIGAFR